MADVLSEIRSSIMVATANGTDGIIARAILLASGQEWTLIDVASRVTSVRYRDDKHQVIYLDGEPILELHDPYFSGSTLMSREEKDQRYSLKVSQNYRLLGKAADAANRPTPTRDGTDSAGGGR